MRAIHVLPLAAALALAACGSNKANEGQKGLSTEDVASAMANAPTPQAGEYTTHEELLDVQMPGVSQDKLDSMRAAFAEGAKDPSSFCLSQDDATKLRQKMLDGMADSDCTVTRFDVSGGTIDGEMQCHGDQGVSGTVALTGTMTSTSSDMVMTFDHPVPNAQPVHLKMRVTTQRTGECSQ